MYRNRLLSAAVSALMLGGLAPGSSEMQRELRKRGFDTHQLLGGWREGPIGRKKPDPARLAAALDKRARKNARRSVERYWRGLNKSELGLTRRERHLNWPPGMSWKHPYYG